MTTEEKHNYIRNHPNFNHSDYYGSRAIIDELGSIGFISKETESKFNELYLKYDKDGNGSSSHILYVNLLYKILIKYDKSREV